MITTQPNQGEMGFFDFYIIREWYFHWFDRNRKFLLFRIPHTPLLISIFIIRAALAKKLKDCGVFGVSSDEYLNYALQNRQEWEVKGLQIVEEYQERLSE